MKHGYEETQQLTIWSLITLLSSSTVLIFCIPRKQVVNTMNILGTISFNKIAKVIMLLYLQSPHRWLRCSSPCTCHPAKYRSDRSFTLSRHRLRTQRPQLLLLNNMLNNYVPQNEAGGKIFQLPSLRSAKAAHGLTGRGWSELQEEQGSVCDERRRTR